MKETFCPSFSRLFFIVMFLAMFDAVHFMRNFCVPDAVEVLFGTAVVKACMDLVSSPLESFDMQRLMYVTQKMNEKLESIGFLSLG
jgi:hypothetical protein